MDVDVIITWSTRGKSKRSFGKEMTGRLSREYPRRYNNRVVQRTKSRLDDLLSRCVRL